MGIQEERLSVLDEPVGVLEVGLAFADGLDLGAAEGDAGLEAVEEEVVMRGGPVEGGVALAGRERVAGLWLVGGRGGGASGRRMGGLAGHAYWSKPLC